MRHLFNRGDFRAVSAVTVAAFLSAGALAFSKRDIQILEFSVSVAPFRATPSGCVLPDGKTEGFNKDLIVECGNIVQRNFNSKRAEDISLRRLQFRQSRLFSIELEQVDLSESSGRGAIFRKVDLQNVNLRKSDLRGIASTQTRWQQVDFRGADLRGASFIRDALIDCDLRGADLREAVFLASSLDRTRFDSDTRLPFSKDHAVAKGMIYDDSSAEDSPPRAN